MRVAIAVFLAGISVVLAMAGSGQAQTAPPLGRLSVPATSNGRIVCPPSNLPAAPVTCRGTQGSQTDMLVSAIDGVTTKVAVGPGTDGGQSTSNGAVICDGCLLSSLTVRSSAGLVFCRSQGTADAGAEINLLCGATK